MIIKNQNDSNKSFDEIQNPTTMYPNDSLENLLCESVGKETFQIWFSGIQILYFEEKSSTTYFSISNSFRLQKIQNQFQEHLFLCAKHLFPQTKKISIQICEKKNPVTQVNISNQTNTLIKNSTEKGSTLKKNSHLTFENYVIGEFNQIPIKFAEEICNSIGKITPLYIHSPVGLGKTHLMHAIANSICKKFPFLKICYITPVDFLEEFIFSLKNKRDSQFRVKYKSVDVLLVDDIQLFSGKEKTCTEFFHIFNEIYQPNKQMVFCSDCPPEQLRGIADRLKSRISSSIITNISLPSSEDKLLILKYFLQNRGIELEESLKEQVAIAITSDIRVIQGFVSSLVSYSTILNKNISVDLCLNLLDQLSNQSTEIEKKDNGEKLSKQVIKIVAEKTNITASDLTNTQTKDSRINFFKNILMYLLREQSNFSLGKIGKIAGKKSGASVQFCINKIQRKMEEDPKINSFVTLLSQKVSESNTV